MKVSSTVRLRAKLLAGSIRFHFGRNYAINEVGNRIYFNPLDYRGQKIWRCGGGGDWDAIRQWKKLVHEWDPSVVIDIGANYGEVALCCSYRPGTVIHLIEPNPYVVPHLERTVESLAGNNEVHIHRWAAGDKGGTVMLYASKWSSGRSTVEVGLKHSLSAEVATRRARLGDVLRIDEPLVFKIDVEGAELRVIEGMRELLAGRRWAGIFEYLHLSADDAQKVVAEFRVFLARRKDLALTSADAEMLLEEARRHEEGGEVRFAQNAVMLPRSD